jgi:hypothetical protein
MFSSYKGQQNICTDCKIIKINQMRNEQKKENSKRKEEIIN